MSIRGNHNKTHVDIEVEVLRDGATRNHVRISDDEGKFAGFVSLNDAQSRALLDALQRMYLR